MIKLIVLDVDGCLTDGKIIYNNEGLESKQFNVKDGLGITSWLKLGNHVAIITGRDSQIVANRAKELGIKHLYQGVKNKKARLEELVVTLGLGFEEVAAIGDDLNDYKMLEAAEISFVPSDASEHVEKIATVSLIRRGGEGAVREMIEYLINKEGLKQKYLDLWV